MRCELKMQSYQFILCKQQFKNFDKRKLLQMDLLGVVEVMLSVLGY